jgi:DNA-binding MarR family transcriptional regulator
MTRSPAVPFETTAYVRDACLCLHTQRAARALARRFDDALRPAALTNGQFSLLMALNRREPVPMREVAELLGADRTTLTAALKPLVRRGLAEVGSDPGDSRVRQIALTAAGRASLATALPLWIRAHTVLETALDGADPVRLRRDLRAMAAAVHEMPAAAFLDNQETAS